MIEVPFIPDPITIDYGEKPMPKTVTVEVELPIPDEYELVSKRKRPAVKGDHCLTIQGTIFQWEQDYRSGPQWILRPIPQEKTWERPEWLKPFWRYITWGEGNGYELWERKPVYADGMWGADGRETVLPQDFFTSVTLSGFPHIDNLPPAERIWKIVERGEK